MGCCLSQPTDATRCEFPLHVDWPVTQAQCQALQQAKLGHFPTPDRRNKRFLAQVVDVYDGDTLTVVPVTETEPWREVKVRLEGVDAPELRTTHQLEKHHAQRCKQVLVQTLLNKTVVLHTSRQTDKFGRWLADVYAFWDEGYQTFHSVQPGSARRQPGVEVRLSTWLLARTPCVAYKGQAKSNVFKTQPYLESYSKVYDSVLAQ